MMPRSICFLFAIALAFAAASVDEISANEDSFAEAEAFVQSFSSENAKGDSACLKVANDSIKVIDDECKALQATVDKAAQANQACCDEGRSAVCSAKAQWEQGKTAHATCITELTNLKKTNVNMGTVSYESLAGKSCYNHNDNSSFKSVKSKVDAKSTECTKKDGTKGTTKKAYDIAVSDASTDRQSCNSNKATALDQAFKKASASCSSATNKKSFIRAEHMKCVLAGTSLDDCNKKMPSAPAVKKTDLSMLSCSAQTGAPSQCIKMGHCISAKGTGNADSGFAVKLTGQANSWNSGCNIDNAAEEKGVKYTLETRWDPYNTNSGHIHAMWGFERASRAKSNKHQYGGIDFAFYCHAVNYRPYIYESGSQVNTNNGCYCGGHNGQTYSWITIETDGKVKYYMKSNHHGKKLCYTSGKKANNFPYAIDTSIYGARCKLYDMKIKRGQ